MTKEVGDARPRKAAAQDEHSPNRDDRRIAEAGECLLGLDQPSDCQPAEQHQRNHVGARLLHHKEHHHNEEQR